MTEPVSKVDELIKLNLREVDLLEELNRVRGQRSALVRAMAGRGQHPAGVMWSSSVSEHQLPANLLAQKRATGSFPVINPPGHVDMRRRPQEEPSRLSWSEEEQEMTRRAVDAAAGLGTIALNPLAAQLAVGRLVPCPNEGWVLGHVRDEWPCQEIGDHVHTADGGVRPR